MNIQAKLIIYAVAVALGVAALWGLYTYVDNKGYQRAAIVYQGKIDTLVAGYATAKADEAERVAAVSNASKAAEARAVAAMQADNIQLQKQLQEQADAADKDPDAAHPALGADSVRRLNAIH